MRHVYSFWEQKLGGGAINILFLLKGKKRSMGYTCMICLHYHMSGQRDILIALTQYTWTQGNNIPVFNLL
jgi:hypothetical protein